MTASDILAELKPLGSESYRRVLMKNHGVREPCFGVKISDLKKIQKRIKRDYQLALDLYETGNYDAMYLAGLIADDARMSRQDLQRWAENAIGGALAGATVPWVATGSPHGWEIAQKWIDARKSHIAVAGWSTLACLATHLDDAALDLPALKDLFERVVKTIHQAPDAVRSAMNSFIIAAGCGSAPLSACALQAGHQIGVVTAHLGHNDCQIPFAPDYIRKVQERGEIGKKRKTVKC